MKVEHPSFTRGRDESMREPRMAKLLAVELSSEQLAPTRVVVRNLSPYGLGARGELDLLPMERVTVHLPDGRAVPALVRWVRKGAFGLSLEERIDPAMLQTGRAASPADLTTRDAKVDFRIARPAIEHKRSGFQRSHRDEILSGSDWSRD